MSYRYDMDRHVLGAKILVTLQQTRQRGKVYWQQNTGKVLLLSTATDRHTTSLNSIEALINSLGIINWSNDLSGIIN